MGAQEFAGVIAAGDRHRVEPKRQEFLDGVGDACLGEIPRIGIDGLVTHGRRITSIVIAGLVPAIHRTTNSASGAY